MSAMTVKKLTAVDLLENNTTVFFQEEHDGQTILSLMNNPSGYITITIKINDHGLSNTTTLERKIGQYFKLSYTSTIDEFITEILELVLPVLYRKKNTIEVLGVEVVSGSLSDITTEPVCYMLVAKDKFKIIDIF